MSNLDQPKPQKKLPQKLIDLVSDIGENAVLFHIYSRIHATGWQAFKNLDESGCDIVVLNRKTDRLLKIEVKTRQSLYTTAFSKKTEGKRQFEVSLNEFREMDLLICYWFDFNAYFIIPKEEINEGNRKVIIRHGKNGGFGDRDKYLNNWDNLIKLMQ